MSTICIMQGSGGGRRQSLICVTQSKIGNLSGVKKQNYQALRALDWLRVPSLQSSRGTRSPADGQGCALPESTSPALAPVPKASVPVIGPLFPVEAEGWEPVEPGV